MSTIADVIEKMAHQNIHIRSIVGDGFSSQFYALSPMSGSSIQNRPDYIERCPAFAPIIYISCNCHLLNFDLPDALESSSSLQQCNRSIITCAHRVRQRENCRVIKKRCPTYSPLRWCHVYLLCRFFAKYYQASFSTRMRIPPELFALGLLVEPLFALVSEFEDGGCQRQWATWRATDAFDRRLEHPVEVLLTTTRRVRWRRRREGGSKHHFRPHDPYHERR
jgi:hypothetical protein